MGSKRAIRRKNKSALVAESVVKSIRALTDRGIEPTFSAIMACLGSRGILSNHRSLRGYLDSLVLSRLLDVLEKPAGQPNIRPKQLYSVTRNGPFVEAGERAMVFHGLNWNTPAVSSVKLRTDLEGIVRGRIQDGTLYASLEDTVVEGLARTREKKEAALVVSYCAALLASQKTDRSYLMQRAGERGVNQVITELLNEIDYLFASPNPEAEDIKSLYAIRKWSQSNHRKLPAKSPRPDWSLLSEDELVDVVGKQLGVK